MGIIQFLTRHIHYIAMNIRVFYKWCFLKNYIKSFFSTQRFIVHVIDSKLLIYGRAVAQAVSRWLPTAAARVSVRAVCGVCGGQIGTGAGFFRVLRFPLLIIPPISLSS
jgi:hypothetical protein